MIGVVGATGYTGALIVRDLRARRLTFVAIGRNKTKLDALPGSFERRVADPTKFDAVRDAIDGCTVVCSCVGPFIDYGEPTLRAAVDTRAHYIDTTGEQAFIKLAFDRYADAPVAVLPGIGFDYVPGDMAAAIASAGFQPDTVAIFYLVSRARSSDGSKRTGLRMASMPCLVRRDGELVERRIGQDERRFAFPEPHGEANVALWPGGEPLTVPRHTGARNVSVYMRMPRVAAAAARGAGLAAPALRAGRTIVGSGTGGPSDAQRDRARFVVVAEASSAERRGRCVIEGKDMYGMTAAACAEASARLSDPAFARHGALAPSEAFDPHGFLNALEPYLRWRVG